MHPDIHTMEPQAHLDQRLRDAAQRRLAAQARATRCRRRPNRTAPELGA